MYTLINKFLCILILFVINKITIKTYMPKIAFFNKLYIKVLKIVLHLNMKIQYLLFKIK